MALEVVLSVAGLIEVCTFGTGRCQYVAAIERGDLVQAEAGGQQFVKTTWHLWRKPAQGAAAGEPVSIPVFLPPANALSLATKGDALYAAVESNHFEPAFLIVWNGVSPDPFALPSRPSTVSPIRLPQKVIQDVAIAPKDEWSTPGLPNRKWIFNPRFCIDKDESLFLCANAADGRGVCGPLVLSPQSTPPSATWEALCFAEALEPVPAGSSDRRFVFCRRAPQPWSVFHNAPRYSGSEGPRLLSIAMVDMHGSTAGIGASRLSEPEKVGPAIMFDCATATQGALVLAVINGPLKRPLLQVSISHDNGRRWRSVSAEPLPSVPIHCRLLLCAQEAVVALSFRHKDKYSVAVASFPLQP